MDGHPVTIETIKAAAERIRGLAHETPILSCKTLDVVRRIHAHLSPIAFVKVSGVPDRQFLFKCELFQKTGSFKAVRLPACPPVRHRAPAQSLARARTYSHAHSRAPTARRLQCHGTGG